MTNLSTFARLACCESVEFCESEFCKFRTTLPHGGQLYNKTEIKKVISPGVNEMKTIGAIHYLLAMTKGFVNICKHTDALLMPATISIVKNKRDLITHRSYHAFQSLG